MSKLNLLFKIFKFYKKPFKIIKLIKSKDKGFSLIETKTNRRFLVRNGSRDVNTINEIFLFKIYSKYLNKIRDCKNIVDIGANIGTFSIFAASKFKDSKVYAYEPSNDSFTLLKTNILMNNLSKRVVVEKKAVSDKNGKRNLHIYPSNYEANSLEKIWNLPFYLEEVDVISINDLFNYNKIVKCDILKIDCEGAEYEIINKIDDKTLGNVKYIIIEYHLGKLEMLKNKLLKAKFILEIEESGDKTGIIFGRRE